MTQEEFMDEARRLRPRLLQVARRYVGDDDAEDTVQDVLLRLWQMLAELRLPLDALASVLVRNRCITLLRQQQRTAATAPTGFAVENAAATVPGGSTAGSCSESPDDRLDRLMTLIDGLPPMQQTVLRLRHVDGMEMKDIAAITGSNEVAVRKMLSRARQTVRQQYLKHDDR